jgi:DNA polymerase-3 subunit gamma/tau
VRGLVGTVGSDVLEDVMDAVARNSSEDVLRTVDRLLVEGQSAQHFARQMVRFLRNTVVAKVAGSDSRVLQISSDERARVARIAERFSEEDLTRFLQIMLRTHSDLGYKQEQRFHLELGLLKLVHAQRLLPLEQLLSADAAKPVATIPRSGGATSGSSSAAGLRSPSAPTTRAATPERPSSRSAAPSPFKGPSPFEADRSRKSEPKAEATPFADSLTPAVSSLTGEQASATIRVESVGATALAVETEEGLAEVAVEVTPDLARRAVLGALEDVGQNMLAHNLELGEWSVRGLEVSVKVAMSQVMVDVALGDGPKRIVHDALAKATGQPMKFKMVSGGAEFVAKPAAPSARPTNGAGARSRAMFDPVVLRMQEKFGAEIRSVIDHKERS